MLTIASANTMTESYQAQRPRERVLETREGYDLWAEFYDADRNPLVAMDELHTPWLLGGMSWGFESRDIGCGTGRHALPIAAAGAIVTAVDFSASMLLRARAKGSTARCASLSAMSNADCRFAAVSSTWC